MAENARLRFDEFEFDLKAEQLFKNGQRVKLSTQPAQLLSVLLQRPEELITREELQKALWGDSPNSDAEHSLNVAVAKIRSALEDSADEPKFVTTVPRRGYRFISPVTRVLDVPELTALCESRAPVDRSQPSGQVSRRGLLSASVVIAGVGLLLMYRWVRMPVHDTSRLAVLPFENLTGKPEQDYVSDGLTEEIITVLGRLQPDRLAVIARTSVIRYKKGSRTVREIGRELGVDYILEGSVRDNGSRTRITTQLIRVKDQSHLWADSYDRERVDLLAVESEVALQVANQIRVTLQASPGIRQDRPIDARAHNEYLLGRYQWNKRNSEGYRKAVAHFELALTIDPAYAGAYAGLADTCLLLAGVVQTPKQMVMKARAAASKALELDPVLAEAHTSLGLIAMNYEWDWAASEREYRRAIELNPNYATAHHWYAEFLNARGRFQEALAAMARARQLDPLSLIIATDTGKVLLYARRYPQAIEALDRVLAEDQSFQEAHIYLVEAYLASAKFEQALAELDRYPNWAREPWSLDRRAFALAKLGRVVEARRAIEEVERRAECTGCASFGYIGLGDTEKALASYEGAVRRRFVSATSLKVHPLVDSLRNEARFQALLRTVGL